MHRANSRSDTDRRVSRGTPYKGLLLLLAAAALVAPTVASAQDANQIIMVPFSQSNLALPHPAHERAHITLKGIIRNAQCNTYDVTWDTNTNLNFDDDFTRRVTREGNSLTVRDIGRTFQVPLVDRDRSYNIGVRVTPVGCAGQAEQQSTYRLFVYDYEMPADPVAWTLEQYQLSGQMALQEVMWFLHRGLNNIRNNNRSDIYGYYSGCGSYCREAEATAIWLMAVNGHLPALPPGTINDYGRALPDGWVEANEIRWRTDPYAETVMRLVNDSVLYGSGVKAVAAADEDSRCGYNPDGSERRCNRIPGTADSQGAWFAQAGTRSTHQRVYAQGLYLGALSIILPSLGGTPVQVGAANTVRGTNWEFYIQQATDYLGGMQIDGGASVGGWYYYNLNGAYSAGYYDLSTTAWAHIGLESAAIAGAPFNVMVPNRVRYRIANGSISNQRGDGGGAYRSSQAGSSFQLTGGSMVGMRWIGAHRFQRGDNTVAFPGYSGYTRDRLRQAYDTYLQYLANNWTNNNRRGTIGWQDRLFQRGDYLCGNRNAVYLGPYARNGNGVIGGPGGGGCMNTYAVYNLQKSFRTGSPELERVGNHDWNREFTTTISRAQERSLNPANPLTNYNANANGTGTPIFGQIRDTFCEAHSVTCAYAPGFISAGMSGLVLTPTIFAPPPVAIATVEPPNVTEGCFGGDNGRVIFHHEDSFHPSPSAEIRIYRWDVDASNGLAWELGVQPDFVTNDPADGTFEYVYQRAGIYTATLQVVDNSDPAQATTTTVRVVVNEAGNVPPSGAHGGPYAVEVGQPLQLRGTATDQNAGCGDDIVAAWDIDDNGAYNDAQGPTAVVPWNRMQRLPVGQPQPIRMRVVDEDGESVIIETTLTVYPAEPVAVARVNPNPAGCAQPVTFDATGSFHPNPARIISQYIWDINGDGAPDDGRARFTDSYNAFGSYAVTLTVVDDRGRRSEPVEVDVDVNLGNNPPIARVSQDEYIVLEGDALNLDGRGSSDPNDACGDSIQSFNWDLDGDGQFDDAVGENPSLNFNELAALLGWPNQAQNNRLTVNAQMRVVDEFGVASVVNFRITIFAGRPIALVVQNPDPSPINLVTGNSRTTLDGRESRSPIDGVDIVRWEWDLDNNPDFEVQNAAVQIFDRQFVPVPAAGNIPVVIVRLRVTDEAGRVSNPIEYRVRYDVPPTAPTADADPTPVPEQGYHILEGESVTLDGSESFDPDTEEFGDILKRFAWDLTYDVNDGFSSDVATVGPPGQAADPRRETTWNELRAAGVNAPGAWPIALEVIDSTDLSNRDTSVLNVYAREPVAALDIEPNPAACGGRVVFDASASEHPHPDIDIVSYAWDLDGDGDFDDADEAQAARVYDMFTFGQPIRVGLRVTDSRDEVSTGFTDLNITEGNRPPNGQAGGYRDGDGRVVGPYVIALGEDLQLDAAGSADPDVACGDDIVSYGWDLNGDGVIDVEGDRPGALDAAALDALNLGRIGNFTVTLTVTDRFGVSSTSESALQIVRGPIALAVASPNRTGCNQQVVFDGSRSSTDGPVGQGFAIVSYEWDFDGDGQFDDGNEARITRPAVAQPGNNGQIVMNASLRITDEAGRTAVDDVAVVIDLQNLPPVANAGGPYRTGPLAAGGFATVRLDGRGSNDPNAPCDSVVEYKWDTNNDNLYGDDPGANDLTGATVDYNDAAWRVGQLRVVRLIACDQFGRCSPPAEAELEVLAVPPPAGEVISPRGDQDDLCINGDNFVVVVDVTAPEGDTINATVVIAGQELGSLQRQVNAGQTVRYEIPVNPDQIPEGRHELIVLLEGDAGGEARLDAGGRITFDHTAPVVNIGNQLPENVCFNPEQVPEPTVDADDNFDPAPRLSQEIVEDGCGRTLRVTATDFCGNVGIGDRPYLVAQPVVLEVGGPADGELVADARVTWDVIGPEACASRVDAEIVRDGGAAQAYAENQLVNQPGDYVMTFAIANCQGVANEQIHRFSVNRPPVAVPIVAGHPNTDPNPPAGLNFAYVIDEGGNLELDATDSRAPEAADRDSIVSYDWDFDNDGQFDDAQGVRVAFNTDDDGTFRAALRVTDSIGAQGTVPFQVTVNDVDPIADGGNGNRYVVDQGAEFRPDASGSQPGSPADLISGYVWEWDDGTPNGAGNQPVHVFGADGVYNVRLTVRDEDSTTTIVVVVEVRDVDPEIEGIEVPQELVELNDGIFIAQVQAGAPNDPITRYEWDFDGDGVPEYAGPNLDQVEHVFRDPGAYTVTLRVRDQDSVAVFELPVNVREMTLAEVIAWKDTHVTAREGAGDLEVPQRFALRNFHDQADQGLFGERNRLRGNTLLAIDRMLIGMISAHNDAPNADRAFGRQLWAMSRQLLREVSRQQARLLADENGPGANADEMRRAASYIERIEDLFEADDFEQSLLNGDNANDVQVLHAAAVEAYYWLSEAESPCNLIDLTIDRDNNDVVQRTAEANDNNDALTPVLEDMLADMNRYAQIEGGAAPGADDVNVAADDFDVILGYQREDVGVECNNGPGGLECINDLDALRLELKGMDLADSLDVAASRGVWVRGWQSCLVNTLKFRIELSVSRLSFVCGVFNQHYLQAREKQAIGEYLIEEVGCALNDAQARTVRGTPAAAVACAALAAGDDCTFGEVDGIRINGKCVNDGGAPSCEPRLCSDPAALDYYKDEDTRCFLIEAYNECLVPGRAANEPYPVDAQLDNVPLACEPPADE